MLLLLLMLLDVSKHKGIMLQQQLMAALHQ
jgi:hypothetical protein